jgi:hypothetical protein
MEYQEYLDQFIEEFFTEIPTDATNVVDYPVYCANPKLDRLYRTIKIMRFTSDGQTDFIATISLITDTTMYAVDVQDVRSKRWASSDPNHDLKTLKEVFDAAIQCKEILRKSTTN